MVGVRFSALDTSCSRFVRHCNDTSATRMQSVALISSFSQCQIPRAFLAMHGDVLDRMSASDDSEDDDLEKMGGADRIDLEDDEADFEAFCDTILSYAPFLCLFLSERSWWV